MIALHYVCENSNGSLSLQTNKSIFHESKNTFIY